MTKAADELKRLQKKAEREKHQKKFARDLNLYGIHMAQEVLFHHTRKWRLDFGNRVWRVGVEIDGAIYGKKSGHNSPKGIIDKMEKMNEAARCGWRVLSFTGDQVQNGKAVLYLIEALKEWGFYK